MACRTSGINRPAKTAPVDTLFSRRGYLLKYEEIPASSADDMYEMKTENYKFTQHKECEFFPCHPTNDPDSFNCLFCYCPLYALGDKCGGNFVYIEGGIKDCSNCIIPHSEGGVEHVSARLRQVSELAKKNRGEH